MIVAHEHAVLALHSIGFAEEDEFKYIVPVPLTVFSRPRRWTSSPVWWPEQANKAPHKLTKDNVTVMLRIAYPFLAPTLHLILKGRLTLRVSGGVAWRSACVFQQAT